MKRENCSNWKRRVISHERLFPQTSDAYPELGSNFLEDYMIRCGAKRHRSEKRCERWAVKGRRRCHLHGGYSTGPRTVEGMRRLIKDGYWSPLWLKFRESERARLQEEWGPKVRVRIRLIRHNSDAQSDAASRGMRDL